MHNLTKIKIFRIILWTTWLPSLLLLYPLALLRRKSRAKHFFLFDRYSLGGAQRVHLDILHSIESEQKEVFFTRYSPDESMKSLFDSVPNTRCRDIHFWCDHLILRIFSVHYWAFYINRHRNVILLSSNSTFFYDVLPFVSAGIKRYELLHNFTYGKSGMEFFGLANHKYLDKRLTVDYITAQNIRDQYQEYKISPAYGNRIAVIEPGVFIPSVEPVKSFMPINVLYAGRGGPQKRIWLIDRIAQHVIGKGWPVAFHFAGTMMEELSQVVKEASVLHGQITDQEEMKELYKACNVILMTSAYEGFPMFIKEGMAFGCIPVVTGLPGNKTHLVHLENAWLLENTADEEKIVEDGISALNQLLEQEMLIRQLSVNAYQYAMKHFNKHTFLKEYRTLLKLPPSHP